MTANFHEMNQNSGSLDMSQKLVAETMPCVGPFDQPRDVGHDERVVEVDRD